MKFRFNALISLIAGASLAVAACSNDNGGGGSETDASAGGSGGSSTGGKTSTGGTSSSGGTTSTGGTSSGGTSSGGSAGAASGGTAGKKSGPDAGTPDGGPDASTPDSGADAGLDPALVARGSYLVNSVALCGSCHTDKSNPTAILGGNKTFVTGLPAPNLTSDATGLGSWTNTQIKNAFRNGIDSDGQPLSSTMPYQLFHNLSDDDADAIVAYLRSLPHVNNDVGERTVAVTAAATPFPLSDFPPAQANGPDAGPELAEAQAGFYLVTSVAQCAKCHSPVNASKAPNFSLTTTFTGGAASTAATATAPAGYYAPNITPDATGITGWTADDIATFLRTGAAKGGVKVCGNMPVGPTGGYGGMTEADAHAIGVYLTNIPAVANSSADLSMEPACL